MQAEQIIPPHLHPRPSRRADRQPVQPQRIAAGDPILAVQRQEISRRFSLTPVQHVALIFRDDQRQTGDGGGEILQLDAAEIGQGDLGPPVGFAPAAVDLGPMRRIVVTGMGLVGPLGSGAEISWKRLLDGKSGSR